MVRIDLAAACLPVVCASAVAQEFVYIFAGDSAYDMLGASVCGPGDLDGDGRPDSLVAGPGAIEPGSTWHFQLWYHDPGFGGLGFNLSDGLRAVFCP